MANREQNLTWAENRSATATNSSTANGGRPDYAGEPLVSLEEDAARELGVVLGDRIRVSWLRARK